jgi:dTDP-4-dehydrorhamnose 3,5-epimerase
MLSPRLIEGGVFSDQRGELCFINDFDLSEIVRFYQIKNSSTNIIRAWQGHQKEQKWFYCLAGSFRVNLVEIDDWENPSHCLPIISFELHSKAPLVLYVPGGFANGFQALEEDSVLLVYSDKTVSESQQDDFRWDPDYFDN